MFIRIGKYQLWMERSKVIEWPPKIEEHRGSTLVWFLKLHLIWDKRETRKVITNGSKGR